MRAELRKSPAQGGHVADEIDEVVAFAVEAIPIDPADFVILAISIVVAGLRVGDLIAGEDQRQALRQQQTCKLISAKLPRSAITPGPPLRPSCPQLGLRFSLA